MLSDKISLIIMSCDKFSDLWDGHVKSLEKYWGDRGIDTYIVTDRPTQINYDNVTVLSVGPETEWSERFLFALEAINTKYAFITLDDYYLIKRVSNKSIEDLVDIMESESLHYLRLFKRPTKATKNVINRRRKVYSVDTSFKYSVNLYSGIWEKEFAIRCADAPQNAWQFEVSLPKKATKLNARCAMCKEKVFSILDVVRKGRILHNAHFYFLVHPEIYTGNREINTWSYELRLGVKTIVGRYTPMPIHNAIKKVMRSMGYEFYSD